MSTHAKYSPSSLEYRDACPGWAKDESDTAAAQEGQLMHSAYETGDLTILRDDEQRRCVQAALDYTARFEKGAEQVLKEVRLEIADGLTFGTADRVIVRKTGVDLIDLKNGRIPVTDAEHNVQGLAYTCGVFERFPKAQWVRVHFMSPRIDELSVHVFRRAQLDRIKADLHRIVARCRLWDETRNPDLLRPSEKVCLYCGFKKDCPKMGQISALVAKKYEPLEVVDEVHSSQITDPERMGRALTLARILEKWCESVKRHALRMADDGTPIPGYRIAERAGATEINNPVLAYEVLVKAGLEPMDIMHAAKLSRSKLEEAVKAKAPRGKGAAAVRELNAALAGAECLTSGDPVRYLARVHE